ncbi:PLP-dependent aminotransferase family protein [Dyella tabacisoli]|nr:PLP-dependent aminotransferase family protein [Dyella tabacisoli]
MQPSSQATVMNFLNEVAGRFPTAISLAAGRPTERFFDRLQPSALLRALSRYEQYASGRGTKRDVMASLLQYGRTAGMIEELISAQLSRDEGVVATPDRLIVTAGCQEALALCLAALCPEPGDVALVCNPTYIGATGAADASGVAIVALPGNDDDLAASVAHTAGELRRQGRTARVLYVIPDFDNPTGRVIDEAQRVALLAVCAQQRIVVLEDNPYGMFRYDGQPVPPMAALDSAGSVIYLSTYSKTLCPALRVGSLTLPQTLFGDRTARMQLFEELTQRKSFLTVNTSQIAQAIVAGLLLEQDCSLRKWVQPAVDLYRDNRDTMLRQLDRVFAPLAGTIGWNRPDGGFFLSLDLPFRFDAEAVTACAVEHGVIVMPMAFFALDASQDRRIRLAFSSVDAAQIAAGVSALGAYIAQRIEQAEAAAGVAPALATAGAGSA